MQQPLQHEWLGSGDEAKLLVEMLLSELGLYLYQATNTAILLGSIYRHLENQGTITLASLSGDDSADALVLHLGTAWADAAKGYNLVTVGQP